MAARLIRVGAAFALALFCAAAHAVAANDARPGLQVRRASLPAALARGLAESLPPPGVLRSIAVDLDRDGDLDVVASTNDALIAVWLNDGMGRLVRDHRGPSPWARAARQLTSASELPVIEPDGPSRAPARGTARISASTQSGKIVRSYWRDAAPGGPIRRPASGRAPPAPAPG